MHEMALAMSVVEIVAETARQHAASRVTKVRLRVGALSSVEPDALKFCFDVAARATVAEGAALIIDTPPGRAYCAGCGNTVTIASRAEACPACQSGQLLVASGDDLAVQDLEVA